MARLSLTAMCCLLHSIAVGATIEVGDVQLAPNTANQMVMFFASGTEMVGGFEFAIQVGDGTGPGLPRITSVDLTTGTIFEGQEDLVETQVEEEDFARLSTVEWETTAPLTLGANGKIATVTFDTTGIQAPVQTQLLLSGVKGALDSGFVTSLGGQVPTTVTNGQITIAAVAAIPEPGSLVLLTLAGVAAGGWRWRRGWAA
jgi:hypothetical protein